MGNKKFSYSELLKILGIALFGYLAKVFGWVDLPPLY